MKHYLDLGHLFSGPFCLSFQENIEFFGHFLREIALKSAISSWQIIDFFFNSFEFLKTNRVFRIHLEFADNFQISQ